VRRALLDAIVLVAAVVVPVVNQLPRLGFYSDDWAFLAVMHQSPDQSFLGVARALFEGDNAFRPIQWVTLAALYKLFGLDPLGYQLFNTAVLALSVVLLYVSLHRLGEPSLLVIGVALLYALLPQYSTDRLWMSTIQANVSAALYFASFIADGEAARSPHRFWGWRALGLLCLVVSALAYEVFLPLFLVGPVILLLVQATSDASRMRRPALVTILATNVLGVLVLVGLKASMITRDVTVARAHYPGWVARRLWHALRVSYGDHVLQIPYTVEVIARRYATGAVLMAAAIVGLAIAAYLLRRSRRAATEGTLPSVRRMAVYVPVGLVVFAAGFAIFPPEPPNAGLNTRALDASAVGVALSLVGAIGCLARTTANQRWWPRIFAASIAVLGASGFLTVHTVTQFWVHGYERQREVLTAIRERFPRIDAGTSFILDGVCPYEGPAIVFDTTWDLAGGLMLLYEQPDIRADIALPSNATVVDDGVVIRTYGEDNTYPFDRLVVFNFARREASALSTAASARAYFGTDRRWQQDCPDGWHGLGAPIFDSQ
jgi:hypothetical protein